jgi:hypothetical protein
MHTSVKKKTTGAKRCVSHEHYLFVEQREVFSGNGPSCDFSEVIAPGERKIVKKVLAVGQLAVPTYSLSIRSSRLPSRSRNPMTVVFVALWLLL